MTGARGGGDDVRRRAESFDAVADAYEEHRPEYPDAVVAWLVDRLGVRKGTAVLDVGAGTGKLSRALVAAGAAVTAVDPGTQLLAILRTVAPDVEARRGSAEELPLPDASVDVVTAAQAYHWFDAARAVPEIHRVLRPGGRMGLLWTWWNESDPRQRPLLTILGGRRTFDRLPAAPWFRQVDHATIPSVRTMTRETLIGRFTSSSAYAAADPLEKQHLLGQVVEVVSAYEPEFELSQLTHVFAFRRLELDD